MGSFLCRRYEKTLILTFFRGIVLTISLETVKVLLTNLEDLKNLLQT